MPKVSVFIASYNHARYLAECLDSILAQTFQDFEIVVVDDGSQDGSVAILEDYRRRHPECIRFATHPGHANKGISATSNLAIALSRGEYLAWIGSDDRWEPEKLQQQVAIMDGHPEVGLVYSFAQLMNESGMDLPQLVGEDVTCDANPVGRMLISCHVPAMTVIFRRRCIDQIGLFDESLVYSDWDLMVRMMSHWKAAFIAKPLAKYRWHGKNISKGIEHRVDLDRILALFRRLEKNATEIGGDLLKPRNQALLELQLAFYLFCARQGEPELHLHRAFSKDPSLVEDVEAFNDWLNQWKPAFYTLDHSHFGLWVIDHLPPDTPVVFRRQLVDLQLNHPATADFFVNRGIQRGQTQAGPVDVAGIFDDCPASIPLPDKWTERVMKRVYPALLFSSFKQGDLAKTRHYWKKTVQVEPSWLKNRGVWSIGSKALLGWSRKA